MALSQVTRDMFHCLHHTAMADSLSLLMIGGRIVPENNARRQ